MTLVILNLVVGATLVVAQPLVIPAQTGIYSPSCNFSGTLATDHKANHSKMELITSSTLACRE